MNLRFYAVLLMVLVLSGIISRAQINKEQHIASAVEGSPYLADAYTKGIVFMKDGGRTRLEMRYNIYKDQFEYMKAGTLELLTADMAISKIELGEKTFVIDKFLVKGKPIVGFFTRLDSGRVTARAKIQMVITPYVPSAPLQDAKPEAYARKPDVYYFRVGNEPMAEIRSLKKVIQSLPDHQKEMEEFAKKEKISNRDPEELIKFFHYYNSLQ